MAIILSHPMTPQEIRVLQEYRRISAETIAIADLNAVKHPVSAGEAPILSLVEKGYLVADEGREKFTLTAKAHEFLALDPKPMAEDAGSPAEPEA
jgi:hypothetical protein